MGGEGMGCYRLQCHNHTLLTVTPSFLSRSPSLACGTPQAEAAISSFKAEQRVKYETMQREEQELGAQVAAMDANVERWAEELVESSGRRGPNAATTTKPRKGKARV